ncbi:MAG: PAS domain S-box protein [Spirochaetia bacterium]|nr:PAS domain S-box protein [Spirochaetia bacterium]
MKSENRKTLLLVEDEVLIAMAKQQELEKYGYNVIHVNTGEKAVSMTSENHNIDLILMDIDLGKGIDGPEAAETILRDHDIPILFVSSHAEPEVVEKTEKITSYGYVVKSSSITVLDASIKMAFKLFNANMKIEESDKRQKTMLSNISDVISIIGVDGIMKYKSPNIEKWFGWQPEDLVGTSGWHNVHPDDLEVIQKAFATLLESDDSTITMEYRYKCKNGTFIPIELTATNLTKDPLINGVLLNYRDISERLMAENKIREKDIQFRKLSANMPDLIYQFTRRVDGSYYVPIASEGIKNIFGCSPEDVIDNFEPISRVLYPEDSERVIRDIEYSANNLSCFTCEFRVQIPGKPIQWIYSRSAPEQLPDGSITWYGFNSDITERKQVEELLEASEERYRGLYENSPLGYQSLDKEGCFVEANLTLCNSLGYAHDEMIGKWFGDFLAPESVEVFKINFPKFKEKGKIHAVPFDMIAKDGHAFSVEIEGEIGHDRFGHFKQTHCVIQDVTERKQKDKALKLSMFSVNNSRDAMYF